MYFVQLRIAPQNPKTPELLPQNYFQIIKMIEPKNISEI